MRDRQEHHSLAMLAGCRREMYKPFYQMKPCFPLCRIRQKLRKHHSHGYPSNEYTRRSDQAG